MRRKTPRPKKYIVADRCVKLWPRACERIWGDADILTGTTEGVVFHHYTPRSRSMLLKYDPLNGVPINSKAHYKIHHSGTPDEVREICEEIRRKRGKAWCDYIDLRTGIDNRGKFTLKWITEQEEYLTKVIETGKI